MNSKRIKQHSNNFNFNCFIKKATYYFKKRLKKIYKKQNKKAIASMNDTQNNSVVQLESD